MTADTLQTNESCSLSHSTGCRGCGSELTGRRTVWCSQRCSDAYWENHLWAWARDAAKKRDGDKCVRCGATALGMGVGMALEVNHIDPRNGAGYGTGCWNHLDNLETLCHLCHVGVTNQQARDRRGLTAENSRQLTFAADLTGDCEIDCHAACAYPGQFSECQQAVSEAS